MDRISHLSDELLLRILSSLPAKDVVATTLLSKRWQPLWLMVPKLEYDHNMFQDYMAFSRFVYTSLLLHDAPDHLETLRFKLGKESCAGDIGVWVKAALNLCVITLIIEIDTPSVTTPVSLPWSLYSKGCRELTVLKLSNMILVDTCSLPTSFPSLESLRLISVKFPNAEFINKLVSSCPILVDLVIYQCINVTVITIRAPSLKYLCLRTLENEVLKDDHGFVIDAPSLECFVIIDERGGYCVIENNMPHIIVADIVVIYRLPEKILSSITCVQRLFLCLTSSKNAYPVGTIFCNLVHFGIGTCEKGWLYLLVRVLKDSPKLRSLTLRRCHDVVQQPRPYWKWNERSSVPGCLLSSLEIVKWVGYEGAKEEKELVAFILRSGSCLKKVTVSSESTDPNKKLEMIKELSLSFRRSPTCALVFE